LGRSAPTTLIIDTSGKEPRGSKYPKKRPSIKLKLTSILLKASFACMNATPAPWLAHLEDEDVQFIKRFILESGSLKDLATIYQVSYPTIRMRLDKLIERIQSFDEKPPADAFDAKVRLLVGNGELPIKLGKELLRIHNTVVKGAAK